MADLDGEEGVGDEVVELERVAHHRGQHVSPLEEPRGGQGRGGLVGERLRHAAGPRSASGLDAVPGPGGSQFRAGSQGRRVA